MKVLIIGSAGLLGQELARIFAASDLVSWDKDEIDITDEQQVAKKISWLAPTIIINAAAYNAVDDIEERFERANLVNGYGVGYLARAAKEAGAVLVHYSTDYVFWGDKKEGYKEDDEPAPRSKYAESKLLGEQELQKNTPQFYLIRLSRLFGASALILGAKKSFVDLMLDQGRLKDELAVVAEEYSSPTYSVDLAQRTWEIIEQEKPFGIYHAANEGACTWYEFAQEIFKIVQELDPDFHLPKLIPVPASRFPRPAQRPDYSRLLNTKLPLMRSWQEALREYLSYKL